MFLALPVSEASVRPRHESANENVSRLTASLHCACSAGTLTASGREQFVGGAKDLIADAARRDTRLVQKEGRSVEKIGQTFGLTELYVRRILALGNLLPRVRSLYRDGEINAASVHHLTLATKAQQKAWLALFDSDDDYCPTGQQLKSWLFGGASISTKHAIFPLETYKGKIVADLFGDDAHIAVCLRSGPIWRGGLASPSHAPKDRPRLLLLDLWAALAARNRGCRRYFPRGGMRGSSRPLRSKIAAHPGPPLNAPALLVRASRSAHFRSASPGIGLGGK